MKTIKVVTRVDEYNKRNYTRNFEIKEKLPEVGDFYESVENEVIKVVKANVDAAELAHNSAADGYEFYEVTVDYKPNMDEEDYEPDVYYIAVKIEEDYE